jgi:hypothetical protein
VENSVAVSSLPRVSERVKKAISRDRAVDKEYILNLFLRIERDNPEIALLIQEISLAHSLDSLSNDMPSMPVNQAITMAALVYRSLEAQFEADEMTRLFNL